MYKIQDVTPKYNLRLPWHIVTKMTIWDIINYSNSVSCLRANYKFRNFLGMYGPFGSSHLKNHFPFVYSAFRSEDAPACSHVVAINHQKISRFGTQRFSEHPEYWTFWHLLFTSSLRNMRQSLVDSRNGVKTLTLKIARNKQTNHLAVLSKVDDFATFKKVEVHAKNSTF